MSLSLTQFTARIIDPVLQEMDMYSPAASELLLGTAIQESRLKYLVQLDNGPALGLFQMEPTTHDDIWENYLAYRADLRAKLDKHAAQAMVGNLYYATAMCRLHYYRVPVTLPVAGNLDGQAAYWKEHYNTVLGAGTENEYKSNWRKAHYSYSG